MQTQLLYDVIGNETVEYIDEAELEHLETELMKQELQDWREDRKHWTLQEEIALMRSLDEAGFASLGFCVFRVLQRTSE